MPEDVGVWIKSHFHIEPMATLNIDETGRVHIGYTLHASDLRLDELNLLLKSISYRLKEERDAIEDRKRQELKKQAYAAKTRERRTAKRLSAQN